MQRVLIIAACLSVAGGTVNYCGAKICGRTYAHTFCKYPRGPGPACVAYMEDPLTVEEKARVLARLNRRRSDAAHGRLRNLPTAGNMLKLRWVEELAREAQVWADQCSAPSNPEENDSCRDLYSISVGQCVASVVGEAPGLLPESMVDMWYLKGLLYRGNFSNDEFDEQHPMDFAQMLWAHTYLVGCARSRFMSMVSGRLRTVTRLVCNLAPRSPGGQLWLPAAPAAACPPRARPDPNLSGLCSYPNKPDTYNGTNEMTLEEQVVLNAVIEIDQNGSLEYHGSLDEIYLTKMAIVTLSNTASTDSFTIQVQKRDIVEPIFAEEKVTDYLRTDKKLIDDTISKILSKTTKVDKSFSKISIIGRPKSYNIEDLEISEDKTENSKTVPVETTTVKEKDVYAEYDFPEVTLKPELAEIVTLLENLTAAGLNATINQKSTENTTEIVTKPENATGLNLTAIEENAAFERNVTNDALKKLLELSKKTDDFPSDPETARELQEALERMEKSLAEDSPTKVRRDIRLQTADEDEDSHDQADPDPSSEDMDKHTSHVATAAQEPLKNKSEDSSPLGMVFKFLPFLKKPIMGPEGVPGEASLVKPLNLLLLVLFVCALS